MKTETQKHTPGPWAVEDQHEREDEWPYLIETPTVTVAGVSGIGVEAEANARLISAAPNILSALRNALPYLQHSLRFYRLQRPGREFWPNREEAEANINEAEAAIAKAEGR